MRMVEFGSACGARLVTEESYLKGQLIFAISEYATLSYPTYQTIQIGKDQHIEELGMIVYMNHSCDPNSVIDTTGMAIYAARNIGPGEELTFFYPSTEWEMARPFACLCGAPHCIGLVAGARFLSVDVLSRHFVNRHIREMMAEAVSRDWTTTLLFNGETHFFSPHLIQLSQPAVEGL